MRTLVVLPTYNEAENISTTLRRLRAVVPAAQVLVVDDSSPDGTAQIARELAPELGRIEVLTRATKDGLGSAYRAGFTRGLAEDYEVLVEMDSDLSHDPAALPSLLAAIDEGADLVVGSRYVPGGSIPEWPWHRRWLSRNGNRYASTMLRFAVADSTSGFRAYRSDMISRIDLNSVRASGYGFQIEMVYRVAQLGGSIVERPIEFVDRELGVSKMSLRVVAEALGLVTWWGIRDRASGQTPKVLKA
ncbi:MAG: polyprenol monophosphomannose synthase [Actinomycetota bacterium]|nr:polyprenol monophosphomannose synthase [Actinomycetota bacterium]